MQVAELTVGQKVNYLAKDGSTKVKAIVEKISKRDGTATLKREDNGKSFVISGDRITKRAGRPAGSVNKPKETAVKPKPSSKPKPKAKEADDVPDFVAMAEELSELHEMMGSIVERIEALKDAVANLAESEESDEEEEVPAKKPGKAKGGKRPMADEDE